MNYILFNEASSNHSPEIEYGSGHTIAFKKGYFMVDTEDTKRQINVFDSRIMVDGNEFYINEKLIFKNEIKAEIVFLQLKIKELQECSYSFFCPKSFKRFTDRYKHLSKDYPEYIL